MFYTAQYFLSIKFDKCTTHATVTNVIRDIIILTGFCESLKGTVLINFPHTETNSSINIPISINLSQ